MPSTKGSTVHFKQPNILKEGDRKIMELAVTLWLSPRNIIAYSYKSLQIQPLTNELKKDTNKHAIGNVQPRR